MDRPGGKAGLAGGRPCLDAANRPFSRAHAGLQYRPWAMPVISWRTASRDEDALVPLPRGSARCRPHGWSVGPVACGADRAGPDRARAQHALRKLSRSPHRQCRPRRGRGCRLLHGGAQCRPEEHRADGARLLCRACQRQHRAHRRARRAPARARPQQPQCPADPRRACAQAQAVQGGARPVRAGRPRSGHQSHRDVALRLGELRRGRDEDRARTRSTSSAVPTGSASSRTSMPA